MVNTTENGSSLALKKLKVLVADDEPAVQMMLKRRLEVSGYDVKVAGNGEEAFEFALSFVPDVIIMDIMMPKMSGDLVAEKLRENPATSGIPVIFLTCLAQRGDIVAGSSSSRVNAISAKPFDSQELLSMIEQVTQS